MQYVSRNEWGARRPKRTQPLRSVRNGIVIHHGGSPLAPGTAEATLRGYQRHHMDTRGWNDIAYSWLVDPHTGTIYEGRGWDKVNGATTGYGTTTIAICIIGHGDQLTEYGKLAINRIIREAEARHNTAMRVRAHRDLAKTACPGEAAYSWIVNGRPLQVQFPLPGFELPGLRYYFPKDAESKVLRRGGRLNFLPAVKTLIAGVQTVLQIPADGVFGPQTEWKIKELQSFFAAPATGIVDERTWGLLALVNGGRLR